MTLKASELVVTISADTTAFDRAADRMLARLTELRHEAETIKKLQPGTVEEVNAVLDGIERMTKVDRQE